MHISTKKSGFPSSRKKHISTNIPEFVIGSSFSGQALSADMDAISTDTLKQRFDVVLSQDVLQRLLLET